MGGGREVDSIRKVLNRRKEPLKAETKAKIKSKNLTQNIKEVKLWNSSRKQNSKKNNHNSKAKEKLRSNPY